MERFLRHNSLHYWFLFLLCVAVGFTTGCSGGSSGDFGDDVVAYFNNRNVTLYEEAPLIEVQGNNIQRSPGVWEPRNYLPRASMESEMYDSNDDGILDSKINEFTSVVNAANRLLDFEMASCIGGPTNKQFGYQSPEPWNTTEMPDQIPASAGAGGTNGTHFIQLILPFQLNPATLFDLAAPNDNLVDSSFLTIKDSTGANVKATVLVNGVDANGVSHESDPNWGQLAGVNVNPGMGKSSLIFVAHDNVAGYTGPIEDEQSFTSLVGDSEIVICFHKAHDLKNNLINLESCWVVVLEGSNAKFASVVSIEATDYYKDAGGAILTDAVSGDDIIQRGSSLIVTFNRPIIPETLGRSIVFDGPPFNGNIGPITSSMAVKPPPPNNPCFQIVTIPPPPVPIYVYDPLCPNVSVVGTLIFEDGTTVSNTQALIPFRITPYHQNNLAKYILNPIGDLPGSSGDPSNGALAINRIRITVTVHDHDLNTFNGVPKTSYTPGASPAPLNMGVGTGQGGLFTPTANDTQTFTVNFGGRYVNAPVCPHALYYTMGGNGIGVVDLDGNGFTTNDPSFTRNCLVTCKNFYQTGGNVMNKQGNDYSYGARAVGQPTNTTGPYIGLGAATPMPGVNECSSGIDTAVKDSNGNHQLFPDPTGPLKYVSISDVEVGDFLDTIFFDQDNPWVHSEWRVSHVNTFVVAGNFQNNLISTPPTPNPPPLTLPIGMRATFVKLDTLNLTDEGAFVIMGKEVFTTDIMVPNPFPPPPFLSPRFTSFIHLNLAQNANSSVDEPFPPNPSSNRYLNTGPVANSSTWGTGASFSARQQIGNFLFATDKSNNVVYVLNSNSMEIITTLTGFNKPDSAMVTTDLKTLYVSNSGGKSVSVINANPLSNKFLDDIAKINVGITPKGLCCQPEMDDIFVCNFGDSTISIINPSTNTVRKTLSSLLKKPWDMVAGPRQFGFGFGSEIYHGYIANHGDDNVIIYESGPDGFGGIGYDDLLDPVPEKGLNGQVFEKIENPRGICWDPTAGGQYPLSGGCYVAHTSNGKAMVSNIKYVAQQAPYGPIFLIPNSGSIGSGSPGFGKRVFSITAQWGGPNNKFSGFEATDVALLDYNRDAWLYESWTGNVHVTNLGDYGQNPLNNLPTNNKHPIRLLAGAYNNTTNPDRLYVSFLYTNTIDVLDLTSSYVTKSITDLPYRASSLKTYFKN